MSTYVGKAVQVQHRVATGHARLRSAGKGAREHVPVPTELQVHDAIVLSETPSAGELPRLTVAYKKDSSPIAPIDIGAGFAFLYDVPHASDPAAEGGLFWLAGTDTTDVVLQEIADELAVEQPGVTTGTVEGDDPGLGSALPSASDRDAAAGEEQAKEATS